RRSLDVSPKQSVWKGIVRGQRFVKKLRDTRVTAAVADNDESEPILAIRGGCRKTVVLFLEIVGKILETVVTEVTMQLAVKRVLLVVESFRRGSRSLEVIGRK